MFLEYGHEIVLGLPETYPSQEDVSFSFLPNFLCLGAAGIQDTNLSGEFSVLVQIR